MIRRSSRDAAGQPVWLLITQTQHAGLSGALAEAWDLSPLPPDVREELVWVAAHHDDGWQAWEGSPGLDGEGRPRSFLEMPVEEANPIWARSIELASEHSPLAGYLVARHFLELRAASRSADQGAARQFVDVHRAQSEDLLRRTRQAGGHRLDHGTAEALLEYLQLFDRLSLALCCGPLAEPLEFGQPFGPTVACRPATPWEVRLDPWPLTSPSLRLDLVVREVPQEAYRDAQHLKQLARPRRVRWSLRAGAGGVSTAAAQS